MRVSSQFDVILRLIDSLLVLFVGSKWLKIIIYKHFQIFSLYIFYLGEFRL